MPDTYWDLFWGYSAFWLLVSMFLFRMAIRQKKLETEMERLSRALSQSEQGLTDPNDKVAV